MDYTNLGRAGVRVSRLCLGTMNFGPFTSEKESFRILDRALEEGVNFLDTANVYGHEKGQGVTEEILGRWFAQGGGRREEVVLATKVYGRMGEGENDRRLSAHHIRRACEESLRRLQTDHLDLYQMHHVDRDTPWEEIWQAMEQLVREGKITYVGSSNFAGWHIAKANEAAARRNFLGIVSEQSLYNLAERTIELEVIPACEDYGVGILPWSPLQMGVLAGPQKEGGRTGFDNWTDRVREGQRERLSRYFAFCEERGLPPARVALAWLWHRPAVTSVIVGPRTMEQYEGCLKALEVKLGEEDLEALDEIWPGPGGPAPEAYAW
jgi:aryl-alcohol dehydrogenase-like predicted oxidoreductase